MNKQLTLDEITAETFSPVCQPGESTINVLADLQQYAPDGYMLSLSHSDLPAGKIYVHSRREAGIPIFLVAK